MSLTKLIIANNGLKFIGGKKLTTFGETTANGNAVTEIYDTNRDATLKEAPWSFALRRIALVDITKPTTTPTAWITATAYAIGDTVSNGGYNFACVTAHTSGTFATDLAASKWIYMADAAIAMTDDSMAKVYSMPTAFLKAYQVSYGASFQIENMLINNGGVSTATPVILSDTASLKLKYVYQCDDPTLYTPEFAKALWTRLAYELCFYVSEATRKPSECLEEYTKIWLPKAKTIDSAAGTPVGPDVYEWERSRLTSGGGIFPPNPGASTWTTIW